MDDFLLNTIRSLSVESGAHIQTYHFHTHRLHQRHIFRLYWRQILFAKDDKQIQHLNFAHAFDLIQLQ